MVTLTLTRDQCVRIDKALNGWLASDMGGDSIMAEIDRAINEAGEEPLPEPWEYED